MGSHQLSQSVNRNGKVFSKTKRQAKPKNDVAVGPDDIVTEIKPYDVLCGKNKTAFNNIGNRRFRILMSLNLQAYNRAGTRKAKGEVIMSVVNILKNDIGARFLLPIPSPSSYSIPGYIDVTNKYARKKVGHALRDLSVTMANLHTSRLKSSSSDDISSYDDVSSLRSSTESSSHGRPNPYILETLHPPVPGQISVSRDCPPSPQSRELGRELDMRWPQLDEQLDNRLLIEPNDVKFDDWKHIFDCGDSLSSSDDIYCRESSREYGDILAA